MPAIDMEQASLVLAAEDFDSANFEKAHFFSAIDQRIITKLIAHGPVLLQGGRGSGKSALLIEASRRLTNLSVESTAIAIYLSLRHSPLLKSEGSEYRSILLGLLSDKLFEVLSPLGIVFERTTDLPSVQRGMQRACAQLGKRLVLMFDDAAHIGREASLSDFFDLFRTLSSESVSCKATIYPGVTSFGDRFDVYNDATVLDVVREEGQAGFAEQFQHVLKTRFPKLDRLRLTDHLDDGTTVAEFLAKAVVGNMRGFIFACNELEKKAESKSVGLSTLGETLIELSNNYYWPLFEEVTPKLGKYKPLIAPAQSIANLLFGSVAATYSSELSNRKPPTRSALIHKEHLARMSKAFEILEYIGFMTKRESSRGMKSGGRGSRYALNLCVLLEQIRGSRLTSTIFQSWQRSDQEPVEIHSTNPAFANLEWPLLEQDGELEIFKMQITVLSKSGPYPYGLTQNMINTLQEAGLESVGALDAASDIELDVLPTIGNAKIRRIRNVIGQAVWM